MSKISSSVLIWIKPYPELKFDESYKGVFCRVCCKYISADRKFLIGQHVKTNTHQIKVRKFNSGEKQQILLPESFDNTSKHAEREEFFTDLCEAFVSADIPLFKLGNPQLKKFLEKHVKKQVPDESTLRKNYINRIYDSSREEIKSRIGDNFVYIQVDETTDVCGRYIANLLIGVLSGNKPSKSYLISSKQLDKTNNLTISRFIHDSLSNFFLPKTVPTEKNLLMLSDAAPYMCKASKNLKVFFPRLIHTTCLAHGLNRVAEEVRNQYPLVNDLINNVKKIFVKAPLRIQFYRDKFPNLPLPPQPVITRWGTWLKATTFFTENYNSIKEFVLELSDDATCIIESKKLFNNHILSNQLAYISSNFTAIEKTILNLEKAELDIITSTELVNECLNKLASVKGSVGKKVFDKATSTISKNEGFQLLSKVAKILSGEMLEVDLDPSIISTFFYAPITSVDVERSFSLYKHILNDRRQRFTPENLEKYLIVHCFKNEM